MKILLVTNWTTSKNLCALWNKMSHGNYKYTKDGKTVEVVWEGEYDYVFVLNGDHTHRKYHLSKVIYSIMEPTYPNLFWETIAENHKDLLMDAWVHSDTSWNNQEYHLSKTWEWLSNNPIDKTYDFQVSTVLSDKYTDPGHILRINFAKFIEDKIDLHCYGGNEVGWKVYKGILPMWCKDDAILPYKYTFNVENNNIPGYITEKLIDGILGECLTFYSGPDNISTFIDPRAYVQLDLNDFEGSLQVIQKAIKENWWEERLPWIKEAKRRILNETGFFPRLWSTIYGRP